MLWTGLSPWIETPIVHRDLTARNVLLTSSLTAKISDLGNSRFINQRSSYLAASMSRCPGTMVYMPPEALNGVNKYGPSLDVFSFGHLALYILIQVFNNHVLLLDLIISVPKLGSVMIHLVSYHPPHQTTFVRTKSVYQYAVP